MPRFLFSTLFVFTGFVCHAQAPISFSFDNQPVEEVIAFMEADYDLVFTYTNAIIDGQYVTAQGDKLPLEQALELIFAKTDISFELVNGRYVVLRAKEPVEIPTFRICGKVIDEYGSGLPIANVLLPVSSTGGSTEEDGSFDFRVRGDLDEVVEISYLGYQAQKRTIRQLQSCPTITLSLAAFSFQEVIIKEFITEGIEQSPDLDHFVLRPDRIKVVPGLTEADVLQMTQILPGIQSQDESATQLNIRGGTPDQNLILWDGIPIYNGGHFFGMISSFNPYIVDQVDVYRSGFGPEYGGRVAGVVDIESTDEIPATFSGNVGINLTHADMALKVPLFKQKSALILSGRRAYSDVIESLTYRKLSQRVFQRGKIGEAQNEQADGASIDVNLSFIFDDLNFKWLWKPTADDQVSISWFGVKDRLDFDSNETDDEETIRNFDELNLNSTGAGLRWDHRWTSEFQSNLNLTSTGLSADYELRFEYLVEDELEDGFRYFQQNTIDDRGLMLNNQWDVASGIRLNFGYQFKDLEVRRAWVYNEDDTDEDTDKNSFHSLFMDFNSGQEGPWKSHVGLRWTYSTALAKDYVEPRLSLQYAPNSNWQVRASAGRYHQFLTQVIELNDLGLNQQLWILADDLEEPPVSRSDHFSLGLFFQASKFQFEVEGYYKTIKGITSFSPAFTDLSSQAEEEEFYEEGNGTAHGVDVLLRNRWKKYQTWLSYSYGRVFYTFESFQDGDPFAATHDRPHSITSVHQWDLGNWNLSLSWNWRSGRVYTAATGVRVVKGDDGEENNFPEYDYSQTNTERLPTYHRLDASILYSIPIGTKGAEGKVGLSMLNLYNRENILSRQYFSFFEEDDDINDYVVEPIDRSMLPFTPNLVVRMSW